MAFFPALQEQALMFHQTQMIFVIVLPIVSLAKIVNEQQAVRL